MAPADPHLVSVFAAALERESAADRAAYLDAACAADATLRERVEALLRAHAGAGRFLEGRPADAPTGDAGTETAVAPGPAGGTVLAGRYKLLEEVGAGGMGSVWRAHELEPVHREVAVKLVKAGMDSRQVLARFAAERQALALMDHPNIAKVLDGGTTAEGRPFFVMELVRGATITEFCDDRRLGVRDRLGLFVRVCQAVQHAHTKGVIHRDLKPSNVLVAEADGAPVPKVIDFGVAKALGQRLTDQTLLTGLAQVVGTPLYMSPEQAGLSDQDVDTRADIYALGVLLYELLTGTTPFDKDRFRAAGYDEVCRIIREEEPPRPSTRLNTLGEAASTVSDNRHSEPRGLSRLLRGELDWIVMKCLEKDRNRRYETAAALAQDTERYLADEPVAARPPSAGYRLGKFARRNKRSLVMAAAMAAAVLVAAGSIGWGVRDRAARRAEAAGQARESLTRARAWVGEDKLAQARQELSLAIGHLGDHRTREPDLVREIEALAADLARFDRFLALIDRAYEAELALTAEAAPDGSNEGAGARRRPRRMERDPARAVPLVLECLTQYAVLERDDWPAGLADTSLGPNQIRQIRRGVYEELLWLANDVTTRRCDHRNGQQCPPTEAAHQCLGYLGKAESVLSPTPTFYRLRGHCRQVLGDEEAAHSDMAIAERTPAVIALDHYFPGLTAYRARDKAKGVEQFHAALRVEPGHYWSLMSLGYCMTDLGNDPQELATAVAAFSGCILKRPDHAHPYVCRSLAYTRMRRFDDAVADCSKAIELNPGLAHARGHRALLYTELGDYARALVDYARALELEPTDVVAFANRSIAHRRHGAYAEALSDASRATELQPTYALAWVCRGNAWFGQQQFDQALADYTRAVELDPNFTLAWNGRGRVHMELGGYREAVADFSEAVKLDPEFGTGWCNRGNAHAKLGQPDQALADHDRCIQVEPTYESAWYNRGTIYLGRKQYPRAIADLSRAVELNARHAEAWSNRGNAYAFLNQYDRALADYGRALEINPRLIEAWYNRGVIHKERRAWEPAVADFSRVIDLDPDYRSALWYRGQICCDQLRRYAEAEADFSRVVAARPGESGAWFCRGNARRLLGRFDEAVADYSQAIEIRRDHADAWHNRGVTRAAAGQCAPAADDFREALRLKPDGAATRTCLAACLNDLAWSLLASADPKGRDPGRAIEMATEAVQLKPQAGDYWLLLGVARFRAGQWQAARTALEKAVELRRGGGCTDWFYLAMACGKLEDREAAARWFDQAAGRMATERVRDAKLLRLASEAASLMGRGEWLVSWARAYSHAEAGRLDEAAADLARVVEHKPKDAQVWYRLALLRLRAGDSEGYRRVCRDMLQQFRGSDDEDSVHHLVWTCALTEGAIADFEPVLEALERIRVKDPKAPAHLQRRGVALCGAGRLAQAAEQLDEARRTATWQGNIWDWLFLVRVHRRLGNPVQADRWSAKVDEWMAKNLEKADWATRLQAEVLHRETQRLNRKVKN